MPSREAPFVVVVPGFLCSQCATAQTGWGARALAGEPPLDVPAIIAFAPGRGGHASDLPNQVCAPRTLSSAAESLTPTAAKPG